MDFYHGKKVLVTGGTGMIGRQLVKLLLERGAKVRIASLDDPDGAPPEVEFFQLNLLHVKNCTLACQGMDLVFHLAGVKGSPALTARKPASFFVPTLGFNTNVLEAARQASVQRLLYTSTIGVYGPAEVFREDDVWKTFPSENDKFAGWAKRMGELQAEAYAIEFGWKEIAIVRPANVYGPFDNFDPQTAMVIPALIHRALSGENPLTVWGDGTAIRDFIHAQDVARGMLLALEKAANGRPINLGSGTGVSIREIVEAILGNMTKKPEVIWDTSKPQGDRKRVMDVARAREIGFSPAISLQAGIAEVMDWYARKRAGGETNGRFNVFHENKFF